MSSEIIGIILIVFSANLIRLFNHLMSDGSNAGTSVLAYLMISVADCFILKAVLIGLKLIVQSW